MRKFRIDPKYICWGITAIIVIVSSTCFFWILQKLPAIAEFLLSFLKILSPFIWGLVITCLLSPIMYLFEQQIFIPLIERFLPDYAKKKSFVRALSIALALVLSFAIVITLIMMVVPQVYESIESIVRSLPDYANQVIVPIISDSDVIGSVALLDKNDKKKFGETEQKLADCAANFLGSQMEQ